MTEHKTIRRKKVSRSCQGDPIMTVTKHEMIIFVKKKEKIHTQLALLTLRKIDFS